MWFIHIPKTAGTSIIDVLSRTTSDKVLFHKIQPRNVYVFHGHRHNWTNPDLLALARRTGRTIVVTAETPLADLKQRAVSRKTRDFGVSGAQSASRDVLRSAKGDG